MARKKKRGKHRTGSGKAQVDASEDLTFNPFAAELSALKANKASAASAKKRAEEAKARELRESIKVAEAEERRVIGRDRVLAGEVVEMTEEELFAQAVADINPHQLHKGKFQGKGPDTRHVRLKEERRPAPQEIDALEEPEDPYHDEAAMFEEIMSMHGVNPLTNNTHVSDQGVDLNIDELYRFKQQDYSKKNRAERQEEAMELMLAVEGPVLQSSQQKLLAAYRRHVSSGNRTPEVHLRGEGKASALRQLEFGVLQAGVRGDRFVRAITGKGLGSVGEPVLKRAVVEWCLGEGADLVVDYAPELLADGTYGSIVLIVRRRRRK